MFKTLRNAWRIPELRNKLLFTLLIVVLYRLGANIPVPYVVPELISSASSLDGSIFQFLNILSGNALGQATLFALGVSPYITSSIVVQLLTVAIPKLESWAKDGEEGKKKITALTRIITIVLALITSIGYAAYIINLDWTVFSGNVTSTSKIFFVNVFKSGYGMQFIVMVACYCAGAALVMWLAEKLNESGIGNGISIILFANIVASLPTTIATIWNTIFAKGANPMSVNSDYSNFTWYGLGNAIFELVFLVALIFIIVWMSDAERRIPIQYAKRVVGRKMYGGQNTHLPLKVNMAGVMPIIFASSIVSLPSMIASLIGKGTDTVEKWFGYTSFPYLIVYTILLFAFAFFYIAISFNPVEVANNIKNNGGAIPGIRVGKPTVVYIKKILNRVTLLGVIILALIACVPMLITAIDTHIFDYAKDLADGTQKALIPWLYGKLDFSALAFGGSSLIIVVGVALETVRELEAQMSLRNYKGFLD